MIRVPPGPKRGFPGSTLLRFRKDPLAYFEKLAREFGDVSRFRLGREHIVFVNHPEFIRNILVTNCNNFSKGRAFFRAGGLLGQGLLTSEGEFHRRQRRMVQPAFHARRIAAFAEVMTKHANRMRSRWYHAATLDASREMMRLTLAVVAETLFGADLESDTTEIGVALTATMNTLSMKMFPVGDVVARLPLPWIRKVQAGRAKLDEIVYRLIDERRGSAQKHDDLLQMLLDAQDERDSTARMTDKQVRDEAITMLLAGQLTTANTLSWTWYLLSQHLEVEGRLHEEVDRVLDSRLPVVADLKSLSYTESPIAEVLRLYPPQWMMTRRVLNDYQVGNYVAPAGSLVVVSPYVMHRD